MKLLINGKLTLFCVYFENKIILKYYILIIHDVITVILLMYKVECRVLTVLT